MTIVVAPDVGAESYCSVSHATAYHAARGNAAWAALASDTVREQLLRKATDHMAVYAARWSGVKVDAAQKLDWPRWGAIAYGYTLDSTTVPEAVANACAELALRAATATLAPDLGAQKQSVKVGPIETTFATGTRQSTKFQAVDNMLAPYLSSGASSVLLVRS